MKVGRFTVLDNGKVRGGTQFEYSTTPTDAAIASAQAAAYEQARQLAIKRARAVLLEDGYCPFRVSEGTVPDGRIQVVGLRKLPSGGNSLAEITIMQEPGL